MAKYAEKGQNRKISRQKNKRRDSKLESTDSPEIEGGGIIGTGYETANTLYICPFRIFLSI